MMEGCVRNGVGISAWVFSDRFFEGLTTKTVKTGRVTTKTVKICSPPKVHVFCHALCHGFVTTKSVVSPPKPIFIFLSPPKVPFSL